MALAWGRGEAPESGFLNKVGREKEDKEDEEEGSGGVDCVWQFYQSSFLKSMCQRESKLDKGEDRTIME